MTFASPRRHTTDAHPFLDLLERGGGLPLVAAASALVAGVAVAARFLVPVVGIDG